MSTPRQAPIDAAQSEAAQAAARQRLAAEADAIVRRRADAYPKYPRYRRSLPSVGLALSGGGIRSATFCLGLIRGLAQNGLLRRLDYLSTVSGGGYIGAAFGRLVSAVGIQQAEETLKASDSVFLTWLRRNGRYLTPAGARDFGMAFATYLRASIAVHLEIGVLAMLVGVLVILPHALLEIWPDLTTEAWGGWRSAWAPIAVATWAAFGASAMAAYWSLQLKPSVAAEQTVGQGIRWSTLAAFAVLAAVATILIVTLGRFPVTPSMDSPGWLVFIGLAAAGSGVRFASLIRRLLANRIKPLLDEVALQRNRLTVSLRGVNRIVLAMLGLAALDWATFHIVNGGASSWLTGGIGIGAVLGVLIRTFAEPLQRIADQQRGASTSWVPRVVNVLGMLTGILLLAAWVSLLQWLVFDNAGWAALQGFAPHWKVLLLALAAVLWLLVTGRNRDTVNASSLHGFYRARLVRAYVSIGNPGRFAATELAMATENRCVDGFVGVNEVVLGDDIRLPDYQPEKHGGPIHLINCCLNQTLDDASDLYNADRKGTVVVASSAGLELGPAGDLKSAKAPGTLGQWITVSGAAAAPGAGSNTTPGWALLLFLVGARLGYWLNGDGLSSAPPAASRRFNDLKSTLLLREALAHFHGSLRSWWFLSDGGHFDNTGVYALLRRELDCIVLADCGADPHYTLDDIENLIRKARIDFDAEIEFYTQAEAARLFPVGASGLLVLSPEDMTNSQSARGVLLARICYHRSNPARRKFGSLLVVKPNLHEALDRDLLAYASRNPSFPQQSTGDQFFDEAQWESYHRLGEDFGRAMTPHWMNRIPGWRTAVQRSNALQPLRTATGTPPPTVAPSVPFWRRGLTATALGTGLGLGAVFTLLVPAWQALDSLRKDRAAAVTKIEDEVKEARSLLANAAGQVKRIQQTPAVDPEQEEQAAAIVKDLFFTSRKYPEHPKLERVATFIVGVQGDCSISGKDCPVHKRTPNLCIAVCPKEKPGPGAAYWSALPVDPDAWRSNPGVAAVMRWLGWSKPQATASATDNAAALPEPAVVPSATGDIFASRRDGSQPIIPGAILAGQASPPPPDKPAAAPSAVSLIDAACKGTTTVYVQIYDESLRSSLLELHKKIAPTPVRLFWPGVENVTRSALKDGGKPPRPFAVPTLIVHPKVEPACARALADGLSQALAGLYADSAAVAPPVTIDVRVLPTSMKSQRRVIELWLPPAGSSADSAAR